MEMLIQDARYALRSLRRTPAFTAAALVTLMLGIGATTAIFTVINATLLRPLPYPDPDRLVQVMRRYPTGTERGQTGRRYLFFRDHLTTVWTPLPPSASSEDQTSSWNRRSETPSWSAGPSELVHKSRTKAFEHSCSTSGWGRRDGLSSGRLRTDLGFLHRL
jgi:hypothetical protein